MNSSHLYHAFLGALLFFAFCGKGFSQTSSDPNLEYNSGMFYYSNEAEIIFSFADISSGTGQSFDQNMRWTPFFNFAGHLNYDFNKNFGVNLGIAVRNVGFIAKFDEDPNDPDRIDRIKYRTYNAGIPIGFKVGDLNQEKPFFFFAGYELELPFHYKQKEFSGSDKENKTTSWFTDRNPDLMHALFAGIQFRSGTAIKFKYYLTEFFDPNYTTLVNEMPVKPFETFNANVFYFSVEFYPFQGVSKYFNKTTPVEPPVNQAMAMW